MVGTAAFCVPSRRSARRSSRRLVHRANAPQQYSAMSTFASRSSST
jgi:hypothetical protein